jgi:hypothetical protein
MCARTACPPDGDDLAAWAAVTLADAGCAGDGLYVATTTAGGRESVAFWRNGLDVGLAFANPKAFPWTLANSPTGAIARALGVRGPTYTLVGTEGAVDAVLAHAAADLADGLVKAAVVVGLDGVDGAFDLAAVVLADGGDDSLERATGERATGRAAGGRAADDHQTAASALRARLDRLR